MRHRALAIIVAAAAFAALPAIAQADSIVYVKDGNVWSASPDGAKQVQLTNGGNYSYVSQADDGTMIALAPGERLHKLSHDGRLLADFPTYVSDGNPTAGPYNRFHGPFEPEISPDGTRVAFEWFNDSYSNGGTSECNASNGCYGYSSRKGVGISYSDRLTGHDEFGLLTGWGYPSWVSNDTLLRSYAGTVLNDDTVFNKIGPGIGDDQLDHWFFDDLGGGTVNDVELSRDRKAVAGILGQADDKLRVYRPTVDPFNAPDWNHSPFAQGNTRVVQPCYEYGEPDGGKFESVSIAPDGKHIAYSVAGGIWISDVPDLTSDCAIPTENALKLPGGHYPDWGPADVPNKVDDTTTPPPPPPPSDNPSVKRLATAKVKLATALKRGLAVRIATSGPGSAKVTARLGNKAVAAGSGPVGANGNAKVWLRFNKQAKRALARKRSVKLKLAVSFTPDGGRTVGRTAIVTLRR